MSNGYKKGNAKMRTLAFIIIAAVIITTIIATTIISGFVKKPDCIIYLEGDRQEQTAGTEIPEEKNPFITLTTARYGNLFSVLTAEIKDVWRSEDTFDLFSTRHKNNRKETTVSSATADNVIAPGTNGTYTFELKNDNSYGVSYTLAARTEITDLKGNPVDVKLPVKMLFHPVDPEWSDCEKYRTDDPDGIVVDKGKMNPNNSKTYRLEWEWKFESTEDKGIEYNDAHDTQLGNLADTQIIVHLITSTEADIDEPTPQPGQTDTPTPQPGQTDTPTPQPGQTDTGTSTIKAETIDNAKKSGIVKTGDAARPAAYMFIGTCAVVTSAAVLIKKKKKREK